MFLLLILAEAQSLSINEYNYPIEKGLCYDFNDISFVRVTITDDTDTKTSVYVYNWHNNCYGGCPILQGYVKSIEYDCDSKDNIFNSSYDCEITGVNIIHTPYYVINGGTTREFDWMM